MDYSHGFLTPACSPFFPRMRQDLGPYLVDKTGLIENIVKKGLSGKVDLVLRPRHCGKITMLLMLTSFFCIHHDSLDPHPEQLFHGLYIASERDICQKHMGKYAVIFCDFRDINGRSWEDMFLSFRRMISKLYRHWHQYLEHSLRPTEKAFFDSICRNESAADWRDSLTQLVEFLARKSGRGVMVFIDEYEAPIIYAFEHGFFDNANEFFGQDALFSLLKTNNHIEYAIIAGVTPVAKAGWHSNINQIRSNALHDPNSIFAGMLMFTETEVLNLRRLSNSELDPEDLRAHYDSYLAAGKIRVYNPLSIMSALESSTIKNFWVALGDHPLLPRKFSEDSTFDFVEALMSGAEVSFKLKDSAIFRISSLDTEETLTLMYYAGYLTMTSTDQFKIPNREVMAGWARWIAGNVPHTDVFDVCVGGPISTFVKSWPTFMQQHLDPKLVAKERRASSHKTTERIYHVYLAGLLHCLRPKGWEVSVEPRAGGGYLDIRLISRKKSSAVLMELKSSEKKRNIEKDAEKALRQIVDRNYRNQESLPNIRILREYGIGCYHLDSYVQGRYLELDAQGQWVEKNDPATNA